MDEIHNCLINEADNLFVRVYWLQVLGVSAFDLTNTCIKAID